MEVRCSVAVREKKAVVFANLTCAQQRLLAEAVMAARGRTYLFMRVPLRMPNQRTIGTRCALDNEPRTFRAAEQQILECLADPVAQTIVVRHYCLVESLGKVHWQAVKDLLVEELGALVRYLVTRPTGPIPVPENILKCGGWPTCTCSCAITP